MIRWETTRKTNSVNIKDLQKYSISDKRRRKRKPTDFFLPQPDAKIPSTIQSDENMSTVDEIENKFYSYNNSSKLSAEAAIVNLMNVLKCPEDDMNIFWSIVCNQSMQSVCTKFHETSVPKIVHKKVEELIQ
jgi:hypothetical protein